MEKLFLLIAFILFSLFLGIVLAKLGGFGLSKLLERKHYTIIIFKRSFLRGDYLMWHRLWSS